MQKNSTMKLLGATLFLAWCAVAMAIFIYYPGSISHMQGVVLFDFASLPEKLSKFASVPMLLNTLISFAGMAFFSISCVSLGLKFFSTQLQFGGKNKNTLYPQMDAQIPIYFLIGNALFSLVLLIIASLSQLTPLVSFIVMVLGFLFGVKHLRKSLFLKVRLFEGKEKTVAFLSFALLIVSIFQSSARISYDASAIYFSNAKMTALEHHTEFFMGNTFVASVFHSVIQFTAVSQIFGDQSARMITWLFGLVNIALLLAIANHVGTSALERRILLPLILTTTAFLDLMGDGKVDLISSAFALGAIYLVVATDKNSGLYSSHFVLSGCFIGFACIVRPYNAFLLGVFVLVHIAQSVWLRSITIREAIKQLAWLTPGIIGLAAYHLFINYVLLGSPFAFWSNFKNINPVNGPWDYNPKTIWVERLLYPIIATFKNSPSSLGSITPLVLVFLPLLVIKKIRTSVVLPPSLLQLTLSAGLALYAWIFSFFAIAEIRYVFFLWMILFIPLAKIAAIALQTNMALIKYTVKGCMVILLGFILLRSAFISISKYAPLDAEGNPQCKNDILCDHYSFINKIAQKNERVLTLSAFRYYLRTDLFACSTNVEEYKKLQELSFTDTDAFWREIYKRGFSYIAFEEDYATRHLLFSDAPFSNLPDWLKLSPLITTSTELRIVAYKINVDNPPTKDDIVCKQDNSGIWHLEAQ